MRSKKKTGKECWRSTPWCNFCVIASVQVTIHPLALVFKWQQACPRTAAVSRPPRASCVFLDVLLIGISPAGMSASTLESEGTRKNKVDTEILVA